MSASPEISLPRFEGPLDLLLTLVRKNEVEITDIPIAEITRQYLNYLHRAEELNIDLGADFVYIAALLIHIKSRSLLPTGPDTAHPEADPRQELIQQLLDHDQLRQGTEFLRQKLEIAGATWSKPPSEQLPEQSQDTLTDSPALNLLQILRLAQQALDTARTYSFVTPADPVSVEEMTRWMSSRLAQTAGRLEGTALLAEQPDGPHRTALFLAMLEMAASGQIRLAQTACFGPIVITFDTAHLCPDVD